MTNESKRQLEFENICHVEHKKIETFNSSKSEYVHSNSENLAGKEGVIDNIKDENHEKAFSEEILKSNSKSQQQYSLSFRALKI